MTPAEAIEAVVHGSQERSQVVGRRLEQIKLPAGASIIAIVRGEKTDRHGWLTPVPVASKAGSKQPVGV